jgi:hypothetical protein
MILQKVAERKSNPLRREYINKRLDPLIKRLKKSKGRMILEAIEAALRTGKTEQIRIEKLTIEHLLPVDWEKYWPLKILESATKDEKKEKADLRNLVLQKIGNLTLLTKKLNPAISNGPCKRKRAEILKHSALNLNRTLPETWNEDTIHARSKELFGTANKIWPRPN